MVIENILKERKKRRKKIVSTILSIIILSIASFFIIINFNLKDSPYNFFIGQKIQTAGEIFNDINFPIYTHKIEENKNLLYLKSSSINLNFFVNKNIKIAGEVIHSHKKSFIINVDTIRDQSTYAIIQNNIYTLAKDLLLLDLSEEYDAYVGLSGGITNLYIGGENILSIKSFVCSKINDSQNCQKIQSNLQSKGSPSFKSYYGYTFLKNKEHEWVAFNGDNLGYIFTVPIDENLVNISHMIKFIDSNFIKQDKNELIKHVCENTKTILSSSIELIENLNMIKIKNSVLNDNNEISECKITVDIYNNWSVVSKI